MGRTVHNLTPEVERVIEIRNAPAYDPDLPAFDSPGVVALCAARGVVITERAVKYATIDGVLASHKIAGRRCWSENDVMDWIRGTRRVGTRRVGTKGGAA